MLNQGWEFIVEGVFKDIPGNSHLEVDFLISRESLFFYLQNFDNNAQVLRAFGDTGTSEPDPSSRWLWQTPQVYTYFRLKEGADIVSMEQKFLFFQSKLHIFIQLGVPMLAVFSY